MIPSIYHKDTVKRVCSPEGWEAGSLSIKARFAGKRVWSL